MARFFLNLAIMSAAADTTNFVVQDDGQFVTLDDGTQVTL